MPEEINYLQPIYSIYDLGYSRSLVKDDHYYDELPKMQSRFEYPVNPANMMSGGMVSNLYIADSELQSENFESAVSGWRLGPTNSEFIDVTIYGTLLAGQIHIPDQNTTANSFHVQNDGDTWWGCTETNFNSNPANATAYVLKDGTARFTTGYIGGNTIGTTYIQSSSFVSGEMGTGWQISSAGSAEFQNVSIRGILRSVTFEYSTISAMSGGLVIAQGSDTLDEDMTAADNSTLTITGAITLAVNDRIRIKIGNDDEWMLVTNTASAPTYTVTRDQASSYSANNNPAWKKGVTVVNYGQSGDGGLYLTASDSNAPYLSVFTHAGSPWSSLTTMLRLGNLNGYLGYVAETYGLGIGSGATGTVPNITIDATNGIRIRAGTTNKLVIATDGSATFSGTLSGVDGTFTGTLSGGAFSGGTLDIGGDDATSFHVDSGGGIWSGASVANKATAPFRVSSAGALVATSATITGTITGSTITGSTFQTGTSGANVVLRANDLQFRYNTTDCGYITAENDYTISINPGVELVLNGMMTITAGLTLTSGGTLNVYNSIHLTGSNKSLTADSGDLNLVAADDVYLSPAGTAIICDGSVWPITNDAWTLGKASYGWGGLFLAPRDSGHGTNLGVFWYYNNGASDDQYRGYDNVGSVVFTVTHPSDIRTKNVLTSEKDGIEVPGLSIINQLGPIAFQYKSDAREIVRYGFSAQDTIRHFPEKNGLVFFDESEDIYYMDNRELIAPLVKAVQELSAEVERLKRNNYT